MTHSVSFRKSWRRSVFRVVVGWDGAVLAIGLSRQRAVLTLPVTYSRHRLGAGVNNAFRDGRLGCSGAAHSGMIAPQ